MPDYGAFEPVVNEQPNYNVEPVNEPQQQQQQQAESAPQQEYVIVLQLDHSFSGATDNARPENDRVCFFPVRQIPVLRTGLTSLSRLLSRRRISVFRHMARLDDDTPANMALQLRINVSLDRPPDRTWRRPPGRPRYKWLDQLRNDSIRPTGDLWMRAVDRGHGGATKRRPSPATRP